jgi:hypothetical protein
MLTRLLREPILQFSILGLLVFLAYGMLAPRDVPQGETDIVVSAGKIEQLATLFQRTWQRPPQPEELQGLIDDYVIEEILVREALALGLDQDDTVIRRRLRQKMEFLADAEIEAEAATDADLQAYLDEHQDSFATGESMALDQVFLNPENHGETVAADAGAVLAELQADPGADPARSGDASLLPATLPMTPLRRIALIFGDEVAAAATNAPLNEWTGPVASAYGLHLIRVTARQAGEVPALSEVREDVLREWLHARRAEFAKTRDAALRARYSVTIEGQPAAGNAP